MRLQRIVGGSIPPRSTKSTLDCLYLHKSMKNEYYKRLPKKRMAAGCLFFNEEEEILIVKPSYKDH